MTWKKILITTSILFLLFGLNAGIIIGEYIQMDSMRTTIKEQSQTQMGLIRFDDDYYSVHVFESLVGLNESYISNLTVRD